ncbi:MAG: type II toxin-antitoxin system PemK/MazF family toxin [Sarcina sp.]
MCKSKRKIAFRGHVYMCDLGEQKGSVQKGCRPVLIISNELNNLHSTVVSCVPITSKSKNNIPTHHTLHKSKYRFLSYEENTVLCEQILTVPKEDLRFIGKIEDDDMMKVNNCLKIQLDL